MTTWNEREKYAEKIYENLNVFAEEADKAVVLSLAAKKLDKEKLPDSME